MALNVAEVRGLTKAWGQALASRVTTLLNVVDGLTATATELNKLAGVTAGTVAASKALVVDANSALDALKISKLKLAVTTFAAGAANITTSVVASAGVNVVATVATDSGGVKLPALTAADVGEVVLVKNSGASACVLYGNGASINGSATSDGYAVAATKTTLAVATASNAWQTFPLAVA